MQHNVSRHSAAGCQLCMLGEQLRRGDPCARTWLLGRPGGLLEAVVVGRC